MPELPDVDGWRRFIAEHASGQRIERVSVPEADVLRNTSPQALGRVVSGERFGDPERHGKWLFAPLADRPDTTVVIHFGMTGRLGWSPHDDPEPRDRHDHVVFECEDGELRVNLQRRFGGVWLARNSAERGTITGPLGPDATELDRAELGELLADRRGGIKSALMDQSVIAGLGNLLADEVLWEARIHPGSGVPDLTDVDLAALHGALETVLDHSIPTGRVPPAEGTITSARDQPSPRCPRCGADLERSQVAGRTTYHCPGCQTS